MDAVMNNDMDFGYGRLKMALEEVLLGVDRRIVIGGLVLWVAGWVAWKSYSSRVNVDTVGVPPGPFGGWRATFEFFHHVNDWMDEGYKKYSPTGKCFKISTPGRYIVLSTSPKILEEMMAEGEDVLSFNEALTDKLGAEWTLHPSIKHDKYHVKLIQTKLTQRLTTILPEVMDELVLAWEENTNIGKEWTKIRVSEVMLQIAARTTNRMFVGAPLCRNQEYLDNAIQYAVKVMKVGTILDSLPRIFRTPLTNPLMQKSHHYAIMRKHVGHILRERKKKMRELGAEWKDRPDDLIQWVLDFAGEGKASSEEELIYRLLMMNFVSIHTTSEAITQTLFDIAAHPELQPPLHAEITGILSKDGMCKQSLTKMKKLDSVIRESQRLSPIVTVSMVRKALVPHTFSDGTHLPAGAWMAAPAAAIQQSNFIPNPTVFDGFRWERMGAENKAPGKAGKYAAVTTSFEHLVWGHGKFACPGRFFATTVEKILLSYLMERFEVRCLEGEGRPKNLFFGMACGADPEGVIEFRMR